MLVEFLEEDLEDDRDFVLIGVNGVWSVFNLQVSGQRAYAVLGSANECRDLRRKMISVGFSRAVPFYTLFRLF